MSKLIVNIRYKHIISGLLLLVFTCPIATAQVDVFDNDRINLWENETQRPINRGNNNYYVPNEKTPKEKQLIIEEPPLQPVSPVVEVLPPPRRIPPTAKQVSAYYWNSAIYGGATGFLIGCLLAAIGKGNDRDSVRKIGSGLVLGSFTGFMVGHFTANRLVANNPGNRFSLEDSLLQINSQSFYYGNIYNKNGLNGNNNQLNLASINFEF
ncbi:MAG: hypothetical protein JJV97_00865 [SAR324 cluster bacterium]|nr:hypothetical protein [SAR324 cluster bacterium]